MGIAREGVLQELPSSAATATTILTKAFPLEIWVALCFGGHSPLLCSSPWLLVFVRSVGLSLDLVDNFGRRRPAINYLTGIKQILNIFLSAKKRTFVKWPTCKALTAASKDVTLVIAIWHETFAVAGCLLHFVHACVVCEGHTRTFGVDVGVGVTHHLLHASGVAVKANHL